MKRIWKAAGLFGIGLAVLAFTPVARADCDDRREYRHERGRDRDRDRDRVSFFFSIFSDGVRASFGNAPRCEPPRRFIPGHYETRREKIVRPGYWDVIVDPAEYGWVRRGCRWEYVVVRPECRRRVWVPERCEWVETQVWIPGRYEEFRFAYAD